MTLTYDLAGNDLVVNSITTGVATPGTASTGSSSLSTIYVSTTNVGTVSANSETVSQLHIDTGSKNITALWTSGAANALTVAVTKNAGSVNTAFASSGGATTQNQSGNGVFTLTLTNSSFAGTDQVFASVAYAPTLGQSGGNPSIGAITTSAGAHVISVVNAAQGATTSGGVTLNFSGNLLVNYAVLKN